ncbi:MAG: RagB/SusD family nutrient uptake outer membrane protein, partial [Bacteroidales bacterium]
MKFNKTISAITLMACLGVSSCSLDEFNPSGSTMEILMKNKSGYQMAINNCYFGLQRYFYGKNNMMLLTEGGTDLWTSRQNAKTYEGYFKYGMGAQISLNLAKDQWNGAYDGIGACNLCIQKVGDVVDFKSEEERNALVAEAHFMRGLYYFFLVEQFGAVTLNMTLPVSVDLAPVKTAPLEIYKQCILPDLEFASQWLPVSRPGQEGRALRKSAMGLLAKAYLQTKEYGCNDYIQSSLDISKKLIEDCEGGGASYGTYLYSDIADVFADANNLENKESLYSVAFSQEGGSTNLWQHNMDYQLFYCNVAKFPAIQTNGHQMEIGRHSNGLFMPSKYLMDLYVNADGSLDPRYNVFFQTEWTSTNDYTWGEDNIKMYDRTSDVTTATTLKKGETVVRIIRPEESDYETLVSQKLSSPTLLIDFRDIYNSDKTIKMTYKRVNDGTEAENPFYFFYPSLNKYNSSNFVEINASKNRFACDASSITMRMAEIYLLAAEADYYLGGSQSANYLNK